MQTSPAFNQGNVGGDLVSGSIAAADFNGDGKLDLAVAGNDVSPGGATILLGNGDGTFKSAGSNLAPDQGFDVIATGDFNGDKIPDLVAANFEGPGGATIFLGRGDGSFTKVAATLPVVAFVNSAVVGDFNQDGKLDVAFGSEPNGISVFLGNGDGTFTEAPGSPLAENALAGLVAGDFNHDGKLDLAGLNTIYEHVDLFLGNGDGTFIAASASPNFNTNSASSLQVVAADFNHDGVPDLAILTQFTTASILLTEPTETATAPANNVAPLQSGTHNVLASYAGDANYPASKSSTVELYPGLTPLVISPAPGTYATGQTISISEAFPGATIYYYLLGDVIDTNGYVKYTGPIHLTEGGRETISAYATEDGYGSVDADPATYAIDLPAAPAPVFSVASGNYPGTQTVTISDSVAGAAIYFTTDGSLVGVQYSQRYTAPVTVSKSEALVAVAIAPGYSVSAPASAQYLIDSSSTAFIYTVAGNGTAGYAGDGGQATMAELGYPQQTALDSTGNLYIADTESHVIRKVAAGTHVITTVAGNGTAGYSGNGGPATSAQLNNPGGVAVDKAGNLYISDSQNGVVRKVDAKTGIITTIAGTGTSGFNLGSGPATGVQLHYPQGIAIDGAGNLYVADTYNEMVRKIAAASGTLTTVAGTGTPGNLGDNGPASSAELAFPTGVAIDTGGNLYIACYEGNVIRKVTATSGVITTVAGSSSNGFGSDGYGGDGGPATSAQLDGPSAVAVDKAGNLYIADEYNQAIRKVTAGSGIISTVAGNQASCQAFSGDGGPAAAAGLCRPNGVTADNSGNIYVTDSGASRIRELTLAITPPTTSAAAPTFSIQPATYATPQTVTIADATPGASIYVTFDGSEPTTVSSGYNGPITVTGTETIKAIAVAPKYRVSSAATAVYTISSPPAAVIATIAGNGLSGFLGAGGPALSARLAAPTSVALDKAGNLYVTDSQNHVVWKVAAATGVISVFAGNGTAGFSGDGGLAAGAQLHDPNGVLVDSSGNVFIADSTNDIIRKVSAANGIISTIAGTPGQPSVAVPSNGDGGPATAAYLSSPTGLALDSSGNLYIADTLDYLVRKIAAGTQIITTVAGVPGVQASGESGDGGLATNAYLGYLNQVAVDSAGNLYLNDQTNNLVRKVSAATHIITTFAGNGEPYASQRQGVPATSVAVDPNGLAVDAAGNLYIANGSAQVSEVNAATGIISRVAGNGYPGFFGNGVSATIAQLNVPAGLAFDAAGNLYLADQDNYRVRKVSFHSAGAAPAIAFSPNAYSFPATAAGTSAVSQAITVKNNGAAALTLSSIALTGANAASFSIVSETCGLTLPAASACTITVGFRPAAGGSLSAALTFADDAAGSPQSVPLGGTGTGTGAGTPQIAFSPNAYSFPSTAVGAPASTQAITVKNNGTAPLTLSSITLTGADAAAFSIVSKTCAASLPEASACTVTLGFKPTARGRLTASLAVTDNAAASPQSVPLAGTGQ